MYIGSLVLDFYDAVYVRKEDFEKIIKKFFHGQI